MTKTTVKDEWIREAMTDDYVVVELLVRLKKAQDATPPPKSVVTALRWGMRQPRSRPMLIRCDDKIDGGDFNVGSRGSPTTPLYWSGGGGAASPLAVDGFEETCSSHLRGSPPAASSRSKTFAQLEEHQANLKRFKLDAKTWSWNEEKTGFCVEYSPSTLSLHAGDDRSPMLGLCKDGCSEESVFLLPDLNMMPWEDA